MCGFLQPLSASAVLACTLALSQMVCLSLVTMAILMEAALWEAATHSPLLLHFLLPSSVGPAGPLSFMAATEAGYSAFMTWLAGHQSFLQLSIRRLLHCLRPANRSTVAVTSLFLLNFFSHVSLWYYSSHTALPLKDHSSEKPQA